MGLPKNWKNLTEMTNGEWKYLGYYQSNKRDQGIRGRQDIVRWATLPLFWSTNLIPPIICASAVTKQEALPHQNLRKLCKNENIHSQKEEESKSSLCVLCFCLEKQRKLAKWRSQRKWPWTRQSQDTLWVLGHVWINLVVYIRRLRNQRTLLLLTGSDILCIIS